MSVGWGQDCVGGVEVELWGECYNIEETTDLDLDYSGLIEEIPPEIGSLINLERIFLGNNQLFGTIPSELGNLTNLYFLDLSSNLLSGFIPESICNLEWNFSMIHNNQLCPPYPECIEDFVGYQDTSECEDISLCDEEYTEIDGECYYQSDLDVLLDFIDLNQSFNGEEPLEIGYFISVVIVCYFKVFSHPELFINLHCFIDISIYVNTSIIIPKKN